MTEEDKFKHYKWCWKKTIENFKKENIIFNFKEQDYDYFKDFFWKYFMNKKITRMRDSLTIS